MYKELTDEEQAEFEERGVIRLTPQEFQSCIEGHDGKDIGPTEIGSYLGVTRTQVYNYQILGRVYDLNPETGDFAIIRTEAVINQGTLGVVRPRKKRGKT